MNLKGNTVNFFENNLTTAIAYSDALDNPNTIEGDDTLYLKGGDGSVVLIDLFGADTDTDGVPDELADLRAQDLLINDAYLTFYVKNDGQENARRIYLYDAENNVSILDYNDSSVSSDPKLNKYIFGGILEKTEFGEAIKYVVRLGAHLNKIIKSTDESVNKNVRLGLAITDNINIVGNASSFDTSTLEFVPVSSVMSPLGAVLYGNTSAVADDKKMKLEIYYTKPKPN